MSWAHIRADRLIAAMPQYETADIAVQALVEAGYRPIPGHGVSAALARRYGVSRQRIGQLFAARLQQRRKAP